MLEVSEDCLLTLVIAVPFNTGSFLYRPHPHVEQIQGQVLQPMLAKVPVLCRMQMGVKKKKVKSI